MEGKRIWREKVYKLYQVSYKFRTQAVIKATFQAWNECRFSLMVVFVSQVLSFHLSSFFFSSSSSSFSSLSLPSHFSSLSLPFRFFSLILLLEVFEKLYIVRSDFVLPRMLLFAGLKMKQRRRTVESWCIHSLSPSLFVRNSKCNQLSRLQILSPLSLSLSRFSPLSLPGRNFRFPLVEFSLPFSSREFPPCEGWLRYEPQPELWGGRKMFSPLFLSSIFLPSQSLYFPPLLLPTELVTELAQQSLFRAPCFSCDPQLRPPLLQMLSDLSLLLSLSLLLPPTKLIPLLHAPFSSDGRGPILYSFLFSSFFSPSLPPTLCRRHPHPPFPSTTHVNANIWGNKENGGNTVDCCMGWEDDSFRDEDGERRKVMFGYGGMKRDSRQRLFLPIR